MASAYNAIANNGRYVKPYLISEIRDSRNNVIPVAHGQPSQVINDRIAKRIMALLLEVVQRGTGHKAAYKGGYAAGKTGTSQGNRDAWFIGSNENLTAAIWVGNLGNQPMSDQIKGGTLPAIAWSNFMENIRHNLR
jgi:penicillin-binding protein 1A